MSRTDDLRKSGGRERGGSSGGASFIKWGESYTWVEGTVVGSFDTKYGLAVTLKVSALHENGIEAQGKDDDGKEYSQPVAVGEEVNLGTQSATLRDKITADDKGRSFHVAFEGWAQGKQNKYRVFTVVELTERAPGGDDPEDTADYSQVVPGGSGVDDGLPFAPVGEF